MATGDSTHGDQRKKKAAERHRGQRHSVQRKKQSDIMQDSRSDPEKSNKKQTGRQDVRVMERPKKE